MDEVIDQICNEIAEEAVLAAVDYLYISCVNAGQESIVTSMVGEFLVQVEIISQGDFEAIDPPHPEAVGEMTEVANAICEVAAEVCKQIREAAKAAQKGG